MRGVRTRVLIAVLGLLAACQRGSGPEAPHRTLDESARALRERFNADAGHVRVILLVAPT
jgi:hypothetical protein